MAVSIRFARFGRKGLPFYRLVVIDSRSPRDGRYLDCLGLYDPMDKNIDYQKVVDKEKAKLWFSRGALPTHSAKVFLSRSGFLQEYEEEKAKKSKTKKNKRKKRYTPISEMLERKAKLKKLAEAKAIAEKKAEDKRKQLEAEKAAQEAAEKQETKEGVEEAAKTPEGEATPVAENEAKPEPEPEAEVKKED